MEIGLYSPLDPSLIGGMRTWLLEFWFPYCLSRGHNLRFIHTGTAPTNNPSAYKPLPENLASFVQLKGRKVPGSGAFLPSTSRLSRALDGVEVLYVDNGYVLHDLVAIRAAKALGVRTISGHHSVIIHQTRDASAFLHNAAWNVLGKRTLRYFDAIHALNAQDARYLDKIAPGKAHVAHLPIDTQVFHPATTTAKKKIVYAGRYHKQKGIGVLAAIFEKLCAIRPDVEVHAIGAGPARNELEPLTKHSNFFLSDPLERPALARALQEARVFVSPSRSETFGFTVAESLACGTPVVCTPTHGYLDIVDEQSGSIQPFDASIDAWVNAILLYVDMPEADYARCRDAAVARGQAFSLDNVSMEFDELLKATTD